MFHSPLLLAVMITFFGLMFSPNNAYSQSEDIIGETTAEELLQNDKVYKIYRDRYKPDKNEVEYLHAVEDSITLYIFIGTWCRESKKYIPGLIKTLDAASASNIHTKFIGVDAQKKFPKSFLKTFNIKYIPTVVVQRGAEEIGRIEEAPRQRIETELVKILSEQVISEN